VNKRKIRILRVLNRFNLGGPAYHVGYLTAYLGSEFETLLVGGPPLPHEASALPILHELGIQPEIIPSMGPDVNPFRELSSLLALRKRIRTFQPDILHTHVSKAGLTGRFASLLARFPGIVIHTFHGHHFHGYAHPFLIRIYQKIERYLARKTHAIITISPHLKEELVFRYRIAPAEKVMVIPLGLDLDRFREHRDEKRRQFREEWNIPSHAFVISIVGRLVPIKNHQLFIECFDQVRKMHPGLPLVGLIVGDGPLQLALKREIEKRNLHFNGTGGILMTSWYKAVDKVYAASDIVVLTSINEGTPVSLIEAQAAGKPVVATEAGGTAHVILHEKTGFITPQNDPQRFTQYLSILIQNPELRKRFGENAEQHAFAQFHYQHLVSNIRNLYFELLKVHGSH